MREIKYRFWDTWNECFTYSGTNMIRFFGLYEQTLIGDNKPILEQYIDLKDENGKEIYEGDKFEVTDGDGWIVGEHIAKMDGNTLSIDGRCIGKIIGNIHQDPKLIK